MSKLGEIQIAFKDALLGNNKNLVKFIVPTRIPSTNSKIKIYSAGYELRLLEVLKDNYAKSLHYLGEDKFEQISRAYITKYPSTFKSVRYFGDKLSEFVLDEVKTPNKHFLADLVRFEWAIEKSFDATDQIALTFNDLEQIPAGDWSEMRFCFHPSLSIEEFGFDMKSIWNVLLTASDPLKISPQRQKQTILFWRNKITSYYKSLEDLEAQTLRLAIAQKNFTDLCENAINIVDLTEVEVIHKISGSLKQWVADGLIVGVYKHLTLKGFCYR